jgi:hypothetical protein
MGFGIRDVEGEISADGTKVTKMLQNIEEDFCLMVVEWIQKKLRVGEKERIGLLCGVWYSAVVVCAQLRVETSEALVVAVSAVSIMRFSIPFSFFCGRMPQSANLPHSILLLLLQCFCW